MTHWFPLGLEVLKHKTEVLERHCEAVGRDPKTIKRTMASPVLLASDERHKAEVLERVMPERRPYIKIGIPDEAADALRPYIEAGFSGFTFNDNILRTPEDIGLAGELLRLLD
jgi:alkanesulfonate monooxygenase SsuD/methylene tetrahydromethanopterin reductase-like flavin-dependent oxidoreductase (luciferase family)